MNSKAVMSSMNPIEEKAGGHLMLGTGWITITSDLEDINSDKGVSPLTLWCVQAKYTKVIEHAKDSATDIKKLDTFLGKFLEELLIREKSKQNENPSQDPNVGSSQVHMLPQISVRDPQVPFVTKGHPKKPTRIKSFLEAPKKGHVRTARNWVTISMGVQQRRHMMPLLLRVMLQVYDVNVAEVLAHDVMLLLRVMLQV